MLDSGKALQISPSKRQSKKTYLALASINKNRTLYVYMHGCSPYSLATSFASYIRHRVIEPFLSGPGREPKLAASLSMTSYSSLHLPPLDFLTILKSLISVSWKGGGGKEPLQPLM